MIFKNKIHIGKVGSIPKGVVAFFLQALRAQNNKSIMYVGGEEICNILRILEPKAKVYFFPALDSLPDSETSPSRFNLNQRISTLRAINDSFDYLIVEEGALDKPLPPQEILLQEISFAVGKSYKDIAKQLLAFGYSFTNNVFEVGEYAVRGNIIDIFPLGFSHPIRLDFFGEQLEEIRSFAPQTQKSIAKLENVIIGPVEEILFTPEIIEKFRGNYRKFFPKYQTPMYEAVSNGIRYPGIEWLQGFFFEQQASLFDYMVEKPIVVSHKEPADVVFTPSINSNIFKIPIGNNRLQSVADFLRRYPKHFVICCALSHGSIPELKTIFKDFKIHEYMVLPIHEGFYTHDTIYLCEYQLFGGSLSRHLAPKKKAFPKNPLRPGELVVHKEHGIGRYASLEHIKVDGTTHDCLKIVYNNDDRLLVPVENLNLLTAYGINNQELRLDSLGGKSWQMRSAKVKANIFAITDQLIALAAQRTSITAPVMHIKEPEYTEFAAHFNFIETDDQATAINDVIQDLAKGNPMDRLLCGDVGFGKTEVAMRAAFVVLSNGYQVLLLCPTTLLARQHFLNFKERGFNYPIFEISRLSKDKIPDTDAPFLLIGTHALLKAEPKKLGLLIIDEEQHFGVKQKERIKTFCHNTHVLSLSATPLPRTLQFAMSGIRDLSLITTPPMERLPIKSFVLQENDSIGLKAAIERELNRHGQIFYVYPRIQGILDIKEKLLALLPNLRIAVAHGELSDHDLENAMADFCDAKYDLLLCTPIIESGIDIQRANTMIIEGLKWLGLAQIHQLKGRIGRGKTQGYAYLVWQDSFTENVQQRIEVIKSLNYLGSGFQLAQHDMDLRGAGNIVGEEQSGHIKSVGIELYQELLLQAVQKNSLQVKETPWTPQLNLGIDVMIPEEYIEDLSLRMEIYQRLASLETTNEIRALGIEMRDRFGIIPESAQNLLRVMHIKLQALAVGVNKIDVGKRKIAISFQEGYPKDVAKLVDFIRKYQCRLQGNKMIFDISTDRVLKVLNNILCALES